MMEHLKMQRQDAWLLLVGEGELEKAVKQQANTMRLADRIIFSGARADVNKLYSAMDVFCLPSFYEGLPVVALEAQANGAAVPVFRQNDKRSGTDAGSKAAFY